MIRTVIALVLAAHGIGHSIGILQTLKVTTSDPAWDGRSWLLSDVAGPTVTDIVGVALWAIALAGFVILGGVVMGWLPQDWWTPVAVISSVASLSGLALFPTAFPTFSTIGALVVDVVVLVAVLWYHWVPGDLAA
jgi:hypothetical protein